MAGAKGENAMLMTATDYRESLRRLSPRVFIDGRQVTSVADEPLLAPGIAGVGVTYDFAHLPAHAALMTACQGAAGPTVNRMLHIDETTTDLLRKLEAAAAGLPGNLVVPSAISPMTR
jgi:4-hydroxybutyryl-CoA dehydratase/vinylacetyl-CoA-Delta-isomerase